MTMREQVDAAVAAISATGAVPRIPLDSLHFAVTPMDAMEGAIPAVMQQWRAEKKAMHVLASGEQLSGT